MITIYVLCYNESIMLLHFIAHYRRMFPECKIIVYDNQSTDSTVRIALENYCAVIPYYTNNKLDDTTYLKIKNNCWKNAKTDWVLIADCDEFCDITEKELSKEEKRGVTMIEFEGYNMVNLADNMDFDSITYGVRSKSYDKAYLFNRKHIKEINYNPGCHSAAPHGYVDYGLNKYICRHYKYFNIDYMIARHKMFVGRLSEENIKRGFGGHYLYTEEQMREEWNYTRAKAQKVI